MHDARSAHALLSPLMKLLFEEGNPAGIKAAMGHLALCERHVRLPLTPASEALAQKLYAAIAALDVRQPDARISSSFAQSAFALATMVSASKPYFFINWAGVPLSRIDLPLPQTPWGWGNGWPMFGTHCSPIRRVSGALPPPTRHLFCGPTQPRFVHPEV